MADVFEEPRLMLMRALAKMRDHSAQYANDPFWPTHTPLYGAGDHEYDHETMVLAVKEATKLGHLESNYVGWPYLYMMRITDAGYNYIRVHDLTATGAPDGR